MIHVTPDPGTTAFTRADIVRLVHDADASLMASAGAAAAAALNNVVRIAALVDADTTGHVQRVADLASGLATACGWPMLALGQLGVAAVLHDVGKVAVPAGLLTKPGPLTSAERRAVEQHTTFARTLLGSCRSPELRMAREVAGHHHERWDGSGYPHALSGPAIPHAARIVALADVFDALTSDRPYRGALSVETALALIADGAGTQFDPSLTAVFLNIHRDARRCA
jgi:putative two-component system response regulator